jgi:hypothetical protein
MEKIFDRSFSDHRYQVGHYENWSKVRIQKIEKIFGPEFFKNKKLLEVACGFGDIGKYFKTKYECSVTFTEGRTDNINFIEQNNPDSRVLLVNHEEPWSFEDKFDVIIHFGLSYHLDNWKNDLRCALDRTDLLIFETEVADSLKDDFEIKFCDYDSWDQAVGKKDGSRTATKASPAHIESVFKEKGFWHVRFDTHDLNSDFHNYTWTEAGVADTISGYTSSSEKGKRRFWVVFKDPSIYEDYIKPSHQNETINLDI